MKATQKGFTVIELILILILAGGISAAGWYVWHKNHNSKQSPSQTGQSLVGDATKNTAPKFEYLTIKDWGVRFKLTADAEGAYYKLRPSGQDTYIDIYSTKFDAIKSSAGKSCKGELLFVMGRYTKNDPRLAEPGTSQPDKTIGAYGYSGSAADQALPMCSYVNADPEANAEFDQSVLNAFKKYKDALKESYKTLEAIQ